MEAIKETVNNAMQALHITSADKGSPAKEPTEEQLNELKEKYSKAGQEQVFAFYNKLSTAEKAGLYEQLSGFNPEYINEITDRGLSPNRPPRPSSTRSRRIWRNGTTAVWNWWPTTRWLSS
jgi:UDP-N-acetylglucosamine/UDP-N-acetylgalactosamine diphosphorylase